MNPYAPDWQMAADETCDAFGYAVDHEVADTVEQCQSDASLLAECIGEEDLSDLMARTILALESGKTWAEIRGQFWGRDFAAAIRGRCDREVEARAVHFRQYGGR